jgi:hypothetical protein
LLFVAGLAIVRNHSIWIYGWQTLLTLVGYMALIMGLLRMLFPKAQQTEFENNQIIMFIEIILILAGIFLTFKAYYPSLK